MLSAMYVYCIEKGHVFICIADAAHDTRLCTDMLKEVKNSFDPNRPTAFGSRDLQSLIVCEIVNFIDIVRVRFYFSFLIWSWFWLWLWIVLVLVLVLVWF
jgi:hypothetical protein